MKLKQRSQYFLPTYQPQPSRWQRLLQTLVESLAGNGEPKIYHRRDRQGNSYLEVYDPRSGQTQSFSTTQEVRVWLEQRYSR
jgi:hypothetical protein